MSKRYYIAYGSNLSTEQMAHRTPDAQVVGTAILYGWQLLFRYHATIEPHPERNTPVLVWEISEEDEKNLDRYEGYPAYYYKKDLPVEVSPLDGGTPKELIAMAYIMADGHSLAEPSPSYYEALAGGYRRFHFPIHVLELALADSIGKSKAVERLGEGSKLAKMLRPKKEEQNAVIGMKVSDFLIHRAPSSVSIFTPGGYVSLDQEGIEQILSGSAVRADAGIIETYRMATAAEILSQVILTASKQNGIWHIMTDGTKEERPDEISD